MRGHLGRPLRMASPTAPEPPAAAGLRRTITGSKMDMSELRTIIDSAAVQNADASSVTSSSQGGSSNVIQIKPGTKNVKAAMRAALREAQGYDDPNDPPIPPLETDIDHYESVSSTPKRRSGELYPDNLVSYPSEPLEGAGAASKAYSESSAPPEGAGGFTTGEFVPPVVEEVKVPFRPRHTPLGTGLVRTITGSSANLQELSSIIENAKMDDAPKTPSSAGGRTPRSFSGLSLNGSQRSGSIVQIQPGCKDIRQALAQAIQESQDPFDDSTPSSPGEPAQAGGNSAGPFAAAGPSLGSIQRPRSIRRLMSEKSFTMDTVYSGMVLDSDMPSEPLEGVGIAANRSYSESRAHPQGIPASPKTFPTVVNGVLTYGDGSEPDTSSVPPSPKLTKSGVGRTISGSQVDLADLAATIDAAAVPLHRRLSADSRSSAGGSTATHRTIKGSGNLRGSGGSQVFGEEQLDEPKGTFGIRAASFSREELEALQAKAAVPRADPDSPRSLSAYSN